MPLLRSIQYQVVFRGGHSTLLFDNVKLVEAVKWADSHD